MYQLFNVFGNMKIERNHILILATAITDEGKPIEKTVNSDLTDPIAEIDAGETCGISFAARMEHGRRPQIAVQQWNARLGGPDLINQKAVRAALKQLIDQF
jgi:hypothetical protein